MSENMIRMLRKVRNMTQEEFADFCSVSRASIARYERGAPISLTNMIKISDACGISVDALVGKGIMKETPLHPFSSRPENHASLEGQSWSSSKASDTNRFPYIRRIRELRIKHQMTQQQVAEYLGTSQTMYARYERGANELPIHHLLKLLELYQIPADYLLGSAEKLQDKKTGKL